MTELKKIWPGSWDNTQRKASVLYGLDESVVRCQTIRAIQERIASELVGAVIAMPEYQVQPGSRGENKMQLLKTLVPALYGVMPVTARTLEYEMDNSAWAKVEMLSSMEWNPPAKIESHVSGNKDIPITLTTDPRHVAFITQTRELVKTSNCWFDPAACLFVRDEKILIPGVAMSLNHAGCDTFPIPWTELSLRPGERMMFCDSTHAERNGVSQAARKGISLEGSTLYVTKFPCRPCALSVIDAGITSVVFARDSYGLEDAQLLVDNNITLQRVVSS